MSPEVSCSNSASASALESSATPEAYAKTPYVWSAEACLRTPECLPLEARRALDGSFLRRRLDGAEEEDRLGVVLHRAVDGEVADGLGGDREVDRDLLFLDLLVELAA